MGWLVYLRKRVSWVGQRLWSLVSGTTLDLGRMQDADDRLE
jgi:hypothetical protein